MQVPGKAGRKKVTLACEANPESDVFVAGTFNNWDATRKPMKAVDGDGHYQAVLMLPPGTHEYKFVVDGAWQIDTSNPQWAPNDFGALNSVVKV